MSSESYIEQRYYNTYIAQGLINVGIFGMIGTYLIKKINIFGRNLSNEIFNNIYCGLTTMVVLGALLYCEDE